MYDKVKKYEMPLSVCRSRSGGAHLYLFMNEPRPAAEVIAALKHWAEVLGYPGAEIFPKQDRAGYRDESGKAYLGNFINLPYFAGERTVRYAFGPIKGEHERIGAIELEEFLDSIRPWDGEDRVTVTPEAPVEPAGPLNDPTLIAAPTVPVLGPQFFVAGSRNIELHRHLYVLRTKYRYSDVVLRDVAVLLNERMTKENPLPTDELMKMIGSVLKHPVGGFEPVWPTLGAAALQGLAGKIVNTIAPYTEADPAALLGQLLAGFGNIIYRQAYFRVESTRHPANLYVAVVGRTSSARKGTSWDHIKGLLREVEPAYVANNFFGGIGSGEGIIWNVRDPRPAQGKKGEPDPGVADKRLLIVETELSGLLQITKREGTTVSAVLRQAWDHGSLQVTNKNSPARATNAHVSIIGHITVEELRRNLNATEKANGFANRFLWVLSQRSKLLPEPAPLPPAEIGYLVRNLKEAVLFASKAEELRRDESARELWLEVYPELTSDLNTGLLGAITGRAAAQVVRLSLLYALLDRSQVITREHLEAAMAFWKYCEGSARHIFGDAVGDPLADQLLRELRENPDGLTRAEISNALGRHQKAESITAALTSLRHRGLARFDEEKTSGRPIERWFPVVPAIAKVPIATQTEASVEEVKGEQIPLGETGAAADAAPF
jgi:hypothetical protein